MKIYFGFILALFLVITGCKKSGPENEAEASKLYQQGNTFYDAGNYKKAIQFYDKAVDLDDQYANAYLKRGDAKRKLRDAKGAIDDYLKTIELKPMNSKAMYHVGTLYMKMGKKDEGCSYVKKAAELCYMPAEKFYKLYCK